MIKKISFLLLVAILFSSCGSTKKTTALQPAATPEKAIASTTPQTPPQTPEKPVKPVKKAKTAPPMLMGSQTKADLMTAPYDTWFTTNYSKYTPAQDKTPAIKQGLKGVSLEVFMGTWCGDSKRETPRMYKILDTAGFKEKNIDLITVDRTKQNPKELTEGKNIKRVPTFIFTKNGEEIGRIVERPVESLEADMIKILSGQPYNHSYEK